MKSAPFPTDLEISENFANFLRVITGREAFYWRKNVLFVQPDRKKRY